MTPAGTQETMTFFPRKRIQPIKVQHDDGQNRAELDHDEKHIHEGFGNVQLDEFVHKYHMSSAADGQPFSNAFNDADDNRFDEFRKIQVHTDSSKKYIKFAASL